jgi:hypothetical protein
MVSNWSPASVCAQSDTAFGSSQLQKRRAPVSMYAVSSTRQACGNRSKFAQQIQRVDRMVLRESGDGWAAT